MAEAQGQKLSAGVVGNAIGHAAIVPSKVESNERGICAYEPFQHTAGREMPKLPFLAC